MDDIRPEDLEAAHEELQPSPLEQIPPPKQEGEDEVWIADELPADFSDEEGPGLTTTEATERNYAMAAHLAGFAGFVFPFGNIIGPLVAWQLGKDKGSYVNEQGKEAVNFQITWTFYFVFALLTILVAVGLLLVPIVAVSWLVLTIIGTVKAANGEPHRYPMTWRLVT
jgi:uncharacterized Tic20 family protein